MCGKPSALMSGNRLPAGRRCYLAAYKLVELAEHARQKITTIGIQARNIIVLSHRNHFIIRNVFAILYCKFV